MTMGNKKWGKAMRSTIEASGLKLSDVVQKLGLGSGTLKQIENGNRNISSTLYDAVCGIVPAVRELPNAPIGRARKLTKSRAKVGRPKGSVNKPKVKAKIKTKRVTTKPPAGRVSRAHNVKQGKPELISVNLMMAILSLKADKKTLMKVQALHTIAMADGVTVEKLQRFIVGDAA